VTVPQILNIVLLLHSKLLSKHQSPYKLYDSPLKLRNSKHSHCSFSRIANLQVEERLCFGRGDGFLIDFKWCLRFHQVALTLNNRYFGDLHMVGASSLWGLCPFCRIYYRFMGSVSSLVGSLSQVNL